MPNKQSMPMCVNTHQRKKPRLCHNTFGLTFPDSYRNALNYKGTEQSSGMLQLCQEQDVVCLFVSGQCI